MRYADQERLAEQKLYEHSFRHALVLSRLSYSPKRTEKNRLGHRLLAVSGYRSMLCRREFKREVRKGAG